MQRPGADHIATITGLSDGARSLCRWLDDRDWDFRAAAAERGVEPAALYREWLEQLGWNQSLAARVYRQPRTRRKVTRQAIEAQMKTFGVVRRPDIALALKGQQLEGGLSAMREVNEFVAAASSRARLCCEQLLELARTQQQLRHHDRARAALVEVVELARSIGAPELVARAIHPFTYSVFQTARFGSHDADEIHQLDDWIALLRSEGELAPLALCLAHLGFRLFVSPGRDERARGKEASREALALAERSGDRTTIALTKSMWTLSCSGPRRLEERIALLAPEVERAGEVETDTRYVVFHSALNDLVEAARFEEAKALASQLHGLERSCTAPWPERYRAALAVFRGQWEEARRLCALRPGVPVDSSAQVLGLLQCEMLGLRGEWSELESLARWTATQSPRVPMHRIALARALTLNGHPEQVREEFEGFARNDFAAVPRDFVMIANLCELAEVCHALGDRGHAAVLYELLSPYRERMIVVRVMATLRGPVAHSLALLAATLGEDAMARADFETALARARDGHSPPHLARASLDFARLLARSAGAGDRERAAQLATQALEQARSVQMGCLVQEADALRAEIGAPRGA